MLDSRLLLILDLDETLIHATEAKLSHPADFRIGPYYVYLRPYLHRFLVEVGDLYDLAIWSSATPDYVAALAGRIMPEGIKPVFVWGRERCTRRFDPERMEEYFVKDLKKVKRKGFDLDRVLVVDDTPEKAERNYGNVIYVTPFLGEKDGDEELRRLASYLQSICSAANVRKIEKRGWRLTLPQSPGSLELPGGV